jgi:predicted RNA-binding protein associated with RNAse of E/G family
LRLRASPDNRGPRRRTQITAGSCDNLGVVSEVHPPKIEVFDIRAMTNTDPKGFVRAVDEYRLEEFGLYMARPVPGHPRLAYFQSWLLPAHGLRVSRWRAHPGVALDHDFYLDVVDIQTGDSWQTRDLYLDILVRTGRDQRVLDTDETLAALHAGLINLAAAQRAFEHAFLAVDGISSAGHDIDAWLARQHIRLSWPRG